MNIIRYVKGFMEDPEPYYRAGARRLVHILYRLRYIGFEKIPATGPAILICNHVTYVDGLIIHAAIPRKVRFVIDERIYNVPAVKYFMEMDKAIPISPNKESVTRALDMVSQALREGDLVCIFPEGQLTYTGNMTRIRFGIEWMVARDPVPVYPMALKGLWGSVLSRKYRKSRLRWLPRKFRRKVTLICGDPILPGDARISHLQRIVMYLKNSV